MNPDGSPTFSALDRHFARLMGSLAKHDAESVALAAALASRAVGEGSVCMDLTRWASAAVVFDGSTGRCPDVGTWREQLLASGIVGEPGAHRPLILDGDHRLYLRRYWSYEQRTADALLKRAGAFHPLSEDALGGALQRLFPPSCEGQEETDWQVAAAIVAAAKGLCILSGGPGTGKTYTAVRIMALLQALSDRPLQMVMAAPTGKAAGRLMASLAAASGSAEGAKDLFDALPDKAYTIHRLLGIRPGATRPRHHRGNPLSADVVVVDEASMIDISLMCRLLEAVSKQATLILIGDRDQLASVEAGAVFGDICRMDRGRCFSTALRRLLSSFMPLTNLIGEGEGGLSDCLVFLERTHRFAAQSAMSRLFDAVNNGDAGLLKTALSAGQPEISWHPAMGIMEYHHWLTPQLTHRRMTLASQNSPRQAVSQLTSWQVLCALNKGPWGIDAINTLASSTGGHGRFEEGRWAAGMPLLILQNDYELGLYNGDIGVIMEDVNETAGGLSAVFSAGETLFTVVDPSRLPAHAPAYALTVHKSQGSEFDHVVMVLPNPDLPILSRELLYTGMTRAKKSLTVVAPEAVLDAAVGRSLHRPSGLGDILWGAGV